ncbi:Uncharacterised protein [Legionella busanensis]|uniref:Fe2OG dioxygenase domain-containing protein n=1 Tax=Legionella busanensis TaxID=190655 RepID=A0A378JVB6_9GAMM|nr:alpha-ketoglutarate-dependent dioxygenase AlkB [Legionella busanensis]STX52152.1 Uncharacterised protein [Legionella busanensis]
MTTPDYLNTLGLAYFQHFISKEEEKSLIQHIQNLSWQKVSLFGQVAKRRVVHFGLDYHYESRTVKPTTPPPFFLQKTITSAANLLDKSSNHIDEILITEYPILAGINWHRDAPAFKEVIGISLLNPTIIYFRKRTNKQEQIKLILEPCSVYILKDEIRWEWEHRIPPVKALRYSITLRTLR